MALLAEIDGIRGEFKSGLRMTPQAITNLKKSTLITSAGSSTRMEGVRLNDEEVVNDMSDTGKAQWNDDGWALERASERLARQKADQKFLIVLSDGTPEESSMHPRSKYELGKMIKKVLEETDQRLIGLGIGRGTEHVGSYYPNSIANVRVQEMAEKLAGLIKEVIANYDKF